MIRTTTKTTASPPRRPHPLVAIAEEYERTGTEKTTSDRPDGAIESAITDVRSLTSRIVDLTRSIDDVGSRLLGQEPEQTEDGEGAALPDGYVYRLHRQIALMGNAIDTLQNKIVRLSIL